MAGFEMNFPDDFLSELLESDFDEIAEAALSECKPDMEVNVKTSLSRSASGEYATGAMVSSVKATKPKKAKTDAWIMVTRPTGKDDKGVRNMDKAMYLEYGTVKQNAKPWLINATKNAEASCMDKMQKVFNKKVGAQ